MCFIWMFAYSFNGFQLFHKHVSSVSTAFRRMLQLLYLDVSKVDRMLHLSPPTFCCIVSSGAGRASIRMRDGRWARDEGAPYGWTLPPEWDGVGAEGAAYVAVGSRGPQARGDVGRGERSLLLCKGDLILREGDAAGA